jgi:hypothetical protein
VQAVSALDQWVHTEVYDRAVGLAIQTSAVRPSRFLRLTIPMELFENVHHHAKTLPSGLREHLQSQLGFLSYQNPVKIKEAFGLISDVSFWPGVAAELSKAGTATTSAGIQDELRVVVERRNAIAHASDRLPGGAGRRAMDEQLAAGAVELIERLATAALAVLGPTPGEAEGTEPRRSVGKRWTRVAVDEAASQLDDPVRTLIERLLTHSEVNGATFNGGTGAEPSAGFYYPTRGGRRSLWSLFRTRTRPSISVNFPLVADIDEEVGRRLVRDLRAIPSVAGMLRDDDETLLQNKYPTMRLDAIAASGDDGEAVLRAFDRVVEGWR